MPENNCQPNMHQVADGAEIDFTGRITCAGCGASVPYALPLGGRLAEHVARLSGYYRLINLDRTIFCPSCGLNIDTFACPCGAEVGLFANVSEFANVIM